MSTMIEALTTLTKELAKDKTDLMIVVRNVLDNPIGKSTQTYAQRIGDMGKVYDAIRKKDVKDTDGSGS